MQLKKRKAKMTLTQKTLCFSKIAQQLIFTKNLAVKLYSLFLYIGILIIKQHCCRQQQKMNLSSSLDDTLY